VIETESVRGAFVMPHYSDNPRTREYTRAAMDSVRQQTDPDWLLIIVDDASPEAAGVAVVEAAQQEDPDRIILVRNATNMGPGAVRNQAVEEARRRGRDFVMFLDCDDVAHPKRAEVTRELFRSDPEVVFVYSPFTVIDENGEERDRDQLTPSIVEILAQFDKEPLTGADCWMRMATETGYATLTSTVSVRTSTMLRYPFPIARGMEDLLCWMRIFAGDGLVHFEPRIPGKYRVPVTESGSSDRTRIGSDYYRLLMHMHRQAYTHALLAALKRKTLSADEAGNVYVAALSRLHRTVLDEGQYVLATEVRDEIDMLTRALQ
jgi:glycosyltransferase involved in cell wall biosynthesis